MKLLAALLFLLPSMAMAQSVQYTHNGQIQDAIGVFLPDGNGNYLGSSSAHPLYVTGGTGGTSSSGTTSSTGAVTQSTGATSWSTAWIFQLGTSSGANGITNPIYSSIVNLPATQPISAASLPLPTGAALAANQPTINTDGGAQSHVMNFPANQIVSDTNSAAFQGEFAMTVGTTYTASRSIKANCSVAGIVGMTYPDASTGLWQAVVGIQTIPAAAISINSSGTTATCTYSGLK